MSSHGALVKSNEWIKFTYEGRNENNRINKVTCNLINSKYSDGCRLKSSVDEFYMSIFGFIWRKLVLFKTSFLLNFLPHSSHSNAFIPACFNLCLFKSDLLLYFLSHCHWLDLSLVWSRSCRFGSDESLKVLSQCPDLWWCSLTFQRGRFVSSYPWKSVSTVGGAATSHALYSGAREYPWRYLLQV